MGYLTMKQLLEAGVHFGHQTRRWNPKMKPYIFGARNGIYIIDLQQTVRMFRVAHDFIRDVVAKGEKVLFVGTKKQAQNAIEQAATRCAMDYVNHRWIGGMLTNFSTIRRSIQRLKELEELKQQGNPHGYSKKELTRLEKERVRLEKNFGGVKNMEELPGALFVVDSKKEQIAIREARKLGIPVVAIVDTNCDPDEVDYVIPGNDDAIRAIDLFSNAVADACIEGRAIYEETIAAQAKSEEAEGPAQPEQESQETETEPEQPSEQTTEEATETT